LTKEVRMKEIWLEMTKGVEIEEINTGKVLLKSDGNICFISVKTAEDQQKVIDESKRKEYVFVDFKDWTVIPLENIIAKKGKGKVIVQLDSIELLTVAINVLEKGADGILLLLNDEKNIDLVKSLIRKVGKIELKEAVVQEVKFLWHPGHRVCLDTHSLFQESEGVLLGNFSNLLFLVANESEDNEFINPRPFRVNAGSMAHYLKVGSETKYLSELSSGDEIEIVDWRGDTKRTHLSRVKIEKRPMLLIRAFEFEFGRTGTITLQNAETIKLFGPDGKRIPVTSLKPGDKILVYSPQFSAGRHFGVPVEETIIER